MALPKQVLAYVSPGFVLERNTFYSLCCFEIGHWKLNLHDGPPGDRQPKIRMLPGNITLGDFSCRDSEQTKKPGQSSRGCQSTDPSQLQATEEKG